MLRDSLLSLCWPNLDAISPGGVAKGRKDSEIGVRDERWRRRRRRGKERKGLR